MSEMLVLVYILLFTGPTVNKKKTKPKSSTPVPDLSDPKDSVISDPKPSTGHFCAIDTHCAETSCKLDTCKELAYEAETGDDESQTEASDFCAGKEPVENDLDDVNKADSRDEKVDSEVNQVTEVTETTETVDDAADSRQEPADSCRTVSSKEEMPTEGSKQGLNEEPGCSYDDGCVKVKESLSSIEERMNSGCDDRIVKDISNVDESKDQNSREETNENCKESEKSGTSNDTVQSESGKELSSESSDVRDSKSWQNMCSVKPSCAKCSSNDSGSSSTGPVCDNVKSSDSSQFIGQTLFNSCKEVTVKESESTANILKTRTYSTADLSAIVDGENAMFPDAFREMAGTDKLVEDSRAERNKTPSVEMDIDGRDSPARLVLSSPTNEDCLTTDSMESSHSEVEKLCRDVLDRGWNVAESETVKLAELYLMFGKDGEIRFEYDWCNTQVAELQEKLLNLNNMLRRLGNIATVEFTDFSKVS